MKREIVVPLEMSDIWHKLNPILTAKERRRFNEWRLQLYLLADIGRDTARVDDCCAFDLEMAEALRNMTLDIPTLSK